MRSQDKINVGSTKLDIGGVDSKAQGRQKGREQQPLIDYTAVIKNKMALLGIKHEIEPSRKSLGEAENTSKQVNVQKSSQVVHEKTNTATTIDIKSMLSQSMGKSQIEVKKQPVKIKIDREAPRIVKEVKKQAVAIPQFDSNIQLFQMLKTSKNKDIDIHQPSLDRFIQNYGWWLPNPEKQLEFSKIVEKNNVLGLKQFQHLKESVDIPQSFFETALRFLSSRLKINQMAALSLLKIHLKHNPQVFTYQQTVNKNNIIVKLNQGVFKDAYIDCKVKQNSTLFLVTIEMLTKIYKKQCSCYVAATKLLIQYHCLNHNQLSIVFQSAFNAYRQRLDTFFKSKKSKQMLSDIDIIKGTLNLMLMIAEKQQTFKTEIVAGYLDRVDSCLKVIGDCDVLVRLAYKLIRLTDVLLYCKGVKVDEKEKVDKSILPIVKKIEYWPIQQLSGSIEAFYLKNSPIFRNIPQIKQSYQGFYSLQWLQFWCYGKKFNNPGQLKIAYDVCRNVLPEGAELFCKQINNPTFHNLKNYLKKLNQSNYLKQLLQILRLLMGTPTKPYAQIILTNISSLVCQDSRKNAGTAFLQQIIQINQKQPDVFEGEMIFFLSKIVEVEPWLIWKLDEMLPTFKTINDAVSSNETISALHSLLKHNPELFFQQLQYPPKHKVIANIKIDPKLVQQHVKKIIELKPYESERIEKYVENLLRILVYQKTIESQVVLLDLLLEQNQLIIEALERQHERIFSKMYENNIKNICQQWHQEDDAWLPTKCLSIMYKCLKYVPLSSDLGIVAIQLNDIVAVLMTTLEASLVIVNSDNILLKMMNSQNNEIARMACKIFIRILESSTDKEQKSNVQSPQLLKFLTRNLQSDSQLSLNLLATLSIHQPILFCNLQRQLQLQKAIKKAITMNTSSKLLIPVIAIMRDCHMKDSLIKIFTTDIVDRMVRMPQGTHKDKLIYLSLVCQMLLVIFKVSKQPCLRNMNKILSGQVCKILFKNKVNYDKQLVKHHNGLWLDQQYLKSLYYMKDVPELIANSMAYCSWGRLCLYTVHLCKMQELDILAIALMDYLRSSGITYTQPVYLILSNIVKLSGNEKIANMVSQYPECLATSNKMVVSLDTYGKRLLALAVGSVLKKMPEKWVVPIQHTMEDTTGIDLFCLVQHQINPRDTTYLCMKYLEDGFNTLNQHHFGIICSHLVRHLERMDSDCQARILATTCKMMQQMDIDGLPAYSYGQRNPQHIIWCWLIILAANIVIQPKMAIHYLARALLARIKVIQMRQLTIGYAEEANCIFQCLTAIELHTNSYDVVEAIELFRDISLKMVYEGRYKPISQMEQSMARESGSLTTYEIYCRLVSLQLCRNLCVFMRLVLRRDSSYLTTMHSWQLAKFDRVMLQTLSYLAESDRHIGKSSTKQKEVVARKAFEDFNTIIDTAQVAQKLGFLNITYIKSRRKHTTEIIVENYNEVCRLMLVHMGNMQDSRAYYKQYSAASFYNQISIHIDDIKINVDHELMRELRKFNT